MKAQEFYKQRSNSIRELWALSPKQIEYIALIMEEYAALHQPPVMGRSEQLIDFAIKNGYIDDMPKGQKDGLIDKFEKLK